MERCRDALSGTEQKPSMHKIFFGKGSKPAPMGKEWPFNGYIKIGEERHKKIKIKEPHPSKTNRKLTRKSRNCIFRDLFWQSQNLNLKRRRGGGGMSYIGNHWCDGKNWASSLRLQTTSFHLHNAVENDRNTEVPGLREEVGARVRGRQAYGM